jgi:hypothetical protein
MVNSELGKTTVIPTSGCKQVHRRVRGFANIRLRIVADIAAEHQLFRRSTDRKNAFGANLDARIFTGAVFTS